MSSRLTAVALAALQKLALALRKLALSNGYSVVCVCVEAVAALFAFAFSARQLAARAARACAGVSWISGANCEFRMRELEEKILCI